jgi:hypothetical protein
MTPTCSTPIASVLRRLPGRFAALLASTTLLLAHPVVAAAAPAEGGPTYADEIRLPNDGLVRGQVTELVPGHHVVLKKLSGEVRRFEWSQIESIALADGRIVDKNATAETMPQPGTEPDPNPQPETEPEPEPEPEPAPFDVDSIGEPVPEAAPTDEKPSKAKPRVTITPTGGKNHQLSLRRVAAGGEGLVGAKVPADTKSEAICDGACGVLVDRPTDTFFVANEGKPIARGFQLGTSDTSYELKVRPKSPIKLWSGVALIPAALLVGIGIGIIPALHNVPQQKVAGYAAGGALISLAGIGGGVTLILFSFDKVKVLPGRGG